MVNNSGRQGYKLDCWENRLGSMQGRMESMRERMESKPGRTVASSWGWPGNRRGRHPCNQWERPGDIWEMWGNKMDWMGSSETKRVGSGVN